MILLGLAYNKFSLKDYRTWLSPFVRLATYFNGRGLNGQSVKWHHCFIYNTETKQVIEALAGGITIHKDLSQYEKVVFLKPNFPVYYVWEKALKGVGTKYNFYLVMVVKLIYQITGIWILKRKPKAFDCAYHCADCLGLNLAERFDAQDFVKMWKDGHFTECNI